MFSRYRSSISRITLASTLRGPERAQDNAGVLKRLAGTWIAQDLDLARPLQAVARLQLGVQPGMAAKLAEAGVEVPDQLDQGGDLDRFRRRKTVELAQIVNRAVLAQGHPEPAGQLQDDRPRRRQPVHVMMGVDVRRRT